MAFADYTSHGAVAVITLNNPPVNALGLSVRNAIADGLGARRECGLDRRGGDHRRGSDVLRRRGRERVRFARHVAAPNLTDLSPGRRLLQSR